MAPVQQRQRLESEENLFDESLTKGNSKVLEARKEKSRDAARSRRSRENAQYLELAKLLPLPAAVTSQLDKASVIKLTMSFLKMRNFSQREAQPGSSQSSSEGESGGLTMNFSELFENDFGLHTLQALDGFLFAVSSDGKFIYVSETISTYLGLSQVELVGSNVYNYVHPDDHKEVADMLSKIPKERDGAFNEDEEMLETIQSHATRIDNEDALSCYIRMKCTLVKRSGCYNKSSGYKTIHVVGRMVPGKDISPDHQRSFALVAVGQPLASPVAINELPPDSHVFISRVGMDLKIVFCEGRINNFMDYKARDIVGISAYEFYHSADMGRVQRSHKKCVKKGEVVTQCYRWMNKSGGWVWMQTMARQVVKSTPHGDEPQILCVNYLISDLEHKGVVMHDIQQYFSALPEDNSPESFNDFEMNPRKLMPSSKALIEDVPGTTHDLIDNNLSSQLWKDGPSSHHSANNNNSMMSYPEVMMSEPSSVGNCSNLNPEDVFNGACIDDYIAETMEEEGAASFLEDIVKEVDNLDAALPRTDADNDADNWSGIDVMLFDDLCRKSNTFEPCQYANSSTAASPFSPVSTTTIKSEAMPYSPVDSMQGRWSQGPADPCIPLPQQVEMPLANSTIHSDFANPQPMPPVYSVPTNNYFGNGMVQNQHAATNGPMPYNGEQYQVMQQRQQLQQHQQQQFCQPPPAYNSLMWQQQQNGAQNMATLNQKMSRLAHPLTHPNFTQSNMYSGITQFY